MVEWADGMVWLNPPAAGTAMAEGLAVTTGDQTDFWRGTFYDFYRDDGHFLHCPATGDFSAELRFTGDYRALYDQAGLMLRANATHWVKAGVEFTDGVMHFSVVVTNGMSDWSVLALPGWSGPLTLRLSRHGDAVRVQYRDAGGAWRLVRLAWFPPELAVEVGPMCCSPTRAGFQVVFHDFALGPPIARDLHA